MLTKASEQCNARAIFNLALRYEKGENVKKDYEKSVSLYQKAASIGDSASLVNLALCYQEGLGVEQNSEEAILLLKKAASFGSSLAMKNLSILAKQRRNEFEAEEWNRKASQTSKVEPIFPFFEFCQPHLCQEEVFPFSTPKQKLSLSDILYQFAQNHVEKKVASELYRLSGELGNWDAIFKFVDHPIKKTSSSLYQLGQQFLEGTSIPKNERFAFLLFKKSASLGHSEAMLSLADLSKDKQEMIEWILKSIKSKNSFALTKLGWLFLDGEVRETEIPLQFKEGQSPAVQLFQQAAEKNELNACYSLGQCFLNGNGVKKNVKKAIFYLKKAADLGHTPGRTSLGICYLNAEKPKGIRLIQEAVSLGDSHAMYALGLCYQRGKGVSVNYQKAFSLLLAGAKGGSDDSSFHCWICLSTGLGVKRNIKRGLKFLSKDSVEFASFLVLKEKYEEGEKIFQKNQESFWFGYCLIEGKKNFYWGLDQIRIASERNCLLAHLYLSVVDPMNKTIKF